MSQFFISFETVPDPASFDPDDQQAAIEPLFAQLVASLRRRGAKLLDDPSEWDSYGWYIDIAVGDARLTCMMQRSDQWLLLLSANRTLMDRLKGRHYEAELREAAALASEAVQDAFGLPRPPVQTEAEFRAG